MIRKSRLAILLALALPVAVAGVAFAPSFVAAGPPGAAASAAAPINLDARFQRYLLSPTGKVRGLLLAGGTAVHLSRHALAKDAPDLQPGDLVHVEGKAMQTPTGTVISRALVQKGGVVIADGRKIEGKKEGRGEAKSRKGKGRRQELSPITSTGKISALVSTKRGRVLFVVMEDGTTASTRKGGLEGLKVGQQVTLSGKGGTFAKGKAMAVRSITFANGETRVLDSRKDKRETPPA
jgi:hypothetical protein